MIGDMRILSIIGIPRDRSTQRKKSWYCMECGGVLMRGAKRTDRLMIRDV